VLGLGLDGAPAASAAAPVDAALGSMDLHAAAERPTALLSGGEWQRTLLARALVAGPGLLLLDEPTTHLDPARRAELLASLDRLGGAVAVVLATHDLECASRCDRVVVLGRGRVAALGAPHDVLTPPILAGALGVRVRRVADPEGGAPLLRVVGPS
jgi:iron complex transport system ATP-binding protein